jgi:hypothetical protein
MEFLQAIFEHLPHPTSHSWFGFVVERGPLIAAIGVLLLFPAEMVLRRWSRHWNLSEQAKRRLELFGTSVLMFTLLVAVTFGLYSTSVNSIPKPQEIIWKEQIASTLHRCVDNVQKLPYEKHQEIDRRLAKKYESAALHCLAYGIQNSDAAELLLHPNAPAAEQFRVHMRLADTLLSIKDVPRILSNAFSIDSQRFLGYGYSLPEHASRYSDAMTREYLIRNRCAMAGKPNGPCADARASKQLFTWILTPSDVAVDPDEKIASLLRRIPPKENVDAFAKYSADFDKGRLTKSLPPLIRFSKFSENDYLGTIGRPSATNVFFSSLAEMWNKSIADAELTSGRIANASSAGESSERIFIWVYFPAGGDDARAATWENVFTMLKYEIKVDPEIASLAN